MSFVNGLNRLFCGFAARLRTSFVTYHITFKTKNYIKKLQVKRLKIHQFKIGQDLNCI